MNLVEIGMVLGVVTLGASTGYTVAEAGRAAAQARADLASASAVAAMYRGMACASSAWSSTVDVMATRVEAAGWRVPRPARAADWRVRYQAARTAGSGVFPHERAGEPLRVGGAVYELALDSPSDAERRVIVGAGGRMRGTAAVIERRAVPAGAHRGRRAHLARRTYTGLGRASGC